MSLTGSLTDFSLPEIFQWLERGNKTGLLTFIAQPVSQATVEQRYYFWVYQGRLVAASNRLDAHDLASLIEQSNWKSTHVIAAALRWCPKEQLLGKYLKKQEVLQASQLKQLFSVQVLQRVCALLQLKNAIFKFESNVPIPTRELTGLSISASEAILIGLRRLHSWDAMAEKLPEPNLGLTSITTGLPHYWLDALEWRVWEYATGTVSLQTIAQQLFLSVEKVQQIAFRLSAAGLVSAHPLLIDPERHEVIY